MTKKEALSKMEADLARSGLTMEQAEEHGFRLVTPREVAKRFPKAGEIWAYEIPYPHNRRRKHAVRAYRIRVLEDPPLPFGAVTSHHVPKYWQQEGTPPAAYIPAYHDVDVALDNKGSRILLVEGEKKALKATLEGYPTIGLGGVWAWMSKKRGWQMLPELEAIDWADRSVYICFDSDASTNPDVSQAIDKLLEELVQREAQVRICTVPEVEEGKKAGLDDFLVARGAVEWERLMGLAPQNDLATKLWGFNRRYVFIRHPTIVVDEHQYDLHGQESHKIHADVAKFKYATATAEALEITTNAKGDIQAKAIKVGEKWVDWRGRRTCDSLTYVPGGERFINGTDKRYNTWRGLGVEAKRGDVRPWQRLLDYLFSDAPKEHRQWFERWCGWPLKYLGTKLYSAACLWGKPARGKSVLAEKILGPIYGANFVSIGQSRLESDFNDWAVSRQFVLVDEVSATDSRERANAIKKLITQTDAQINEKFVGGYTLPDCMNFFMTSNSPRAFHVEDDDRRYFIHRAPENPQPRAFWDELLDQWAPKGGRAALLYYFQNDLNYGDFRPDAPPPVTEAKEEMIAICRHPAEDWLRSFVGSQLFTAKGRREVYSTTELCALYRAGSDKFIAPNAFGAFITGAGLSKRSVRAGEAIQRLVAVTEAAKWHKRDSKAWLAEFNRLPGKKF